MRRNVELKARLRDLDAARLAAQTVGAKFVRRWRQVDQFFDVPTGRLKLRLDEGEPAQLIWYDRPDGTGDRLSQYKILPLADGDACERLLSAALKKGVRVEKIRELHLVENVRIHLDEVAGLGTFLEFEAVLADGESERPARDRLQQLAAAFSIKESDRLAVAYADMLLSNQMP